MKEERINYFHYWAAGQKETTRQYWFYRMDKAHSSRFQFLTHCKYHPEKRKLSFLLWDRVEELHGVILFLLVLIGIGFVVFFLALSWRRSFIFLANRAMFSFGLMRFKLFKQIVNALDAFAEMPQDMVFRIVYKAFGLTFVYTFITMAWMVVSMNAFQLHIEPLSVLFVSCILQLLSMIPVIVFGGLGIAEVTSLYLYTMLGMPGDELAIVLIGWRIFYYVTNLLLVLYLPIYALFIEPKIPSEK